MLYYSKKIISTDNAKLIPIAILKRRCCCLFLMSFFKPTPPRSHIATAGRQQTKNAVAMVRTSNGILPPTVVKADTAIKMSGALFLLYLSWQIATTKRTIDGEEASQPLTFIQAVLFQWVNPKAWVVIISAFSAFTTTSGNMTLEALTIASIFFLARLPANTLWLLSGAGLKKIIKNERQQRRFNMAMGISLALSMLIIFFE